MSCYIHRSTTCMHKNIKVQREQKKSLQGETIVNPASLGYSLSVLNKTSTFKKEMPVHSPQSIWLSDSEGRHNKTCCVDDITKRHNITKLHAEYPLSRDIVVPRYSTGETGFYFQSRKTSRPSMAGGYTTRSSKCSWTHLTQGRRAREHRQPF